MASPIPSGPSTSLDHASARPESGPSSGSVAVPWNVTMSVSVAEERSAGLVMFTVGGAFPVVDQTTCTSTGIRQAKGSTLR